MQMSKKITEIKISLVTFIKMNSFDICKSYVS